MSISRSEKLHKRFTSDILWTNFNKKCGIGRFNSDGHKAEWQSGVFCRLARLIYDPEELADATRLQKMWNRPFYLLTALKNTYEALRRFGQMLYRLHMDWMLETLLCMQLRPSTILSPIRKLFLHLYRRVSTFLH